MNSRKPAPEPEQSGAGWLTLVFQLPAKPAYLRVKLWRRLKSIGAVTLKNAVYTLPANDEALEDFQWLLGEIEKSGGEGIICESHILKGMRDDQVRALFDTARDADYAELAEELKALAKSRKRRAKDGDGTDQKVQLGRIRKRFAEIGEIDFFGATGRMRIEGMLTEMEKNLIGSPASKPAKDASKLKDFLGRTWVTRRGVHVDRIACAWLVRRFVDADATFKFVAEKDYAPKPGEFRFDMFQGEFTHEGDKCSFEVLMERAGLDDDALRAVGEIVHDIDLKDRKFGREETAGIAHVIAGICTAQKDDLLRIEQGSAIFDGTYERFRKKRGR
jgi:hypothetical protein